MRVWRKEIDAFEQFKKGREENFGAVTDLISKQTYDYVLRMTGDSKSAKIFSSDLYSLITEQAHSSDDFFDLRREVFKKARLSHLDIWNMETLHLENEGFAYSEGFDKKRAILMSLDKVLNALPGSNREAFLLREYYRLDDRDASDVMDMSAENIDQLCDEAEHKIKSQINFAGEFDEMLPALPLHPLPEVSDYSSIALSQIIENVQRSQPKRWPDQRRIITFAVIMLVVLVTAYFFLPD
jgi:DNA-directed RNA polymerase specialized sigma24 family protein